MIAPTFRILAILAVTLTASVSLSAERVFDKRFPVAAGGHLRVDAEIGSVTVAGSAGNEVVIHAQLTGSDEFLTHLEIRAEQSGSGVTVTAHKTGLSWFDRFDFGRERVEFTINVPHDCSVELRTAGGHLDVRAVSAPVHGTTSGGGIVVRNVSGPVTMHTSGGNIDAEGLDGASELETSGGNIRVADARGGLDVRTSGGGISLKNIDASVRAESSGGSVDAEMRSNRGISLSTSGGSISLSLPKNAGASIDARTSGGRVSSAVPLSRTEIADDSRLRGTINGGGESITLHTSGGSIRVAPLL